MSKLSKWTDWIKIKSGIAENSARLDRIEKKLALSLALQRSILPEKLIFPQEIFDVVHKWHSQLGEGTTEIHKNDIMFLFSLHHHYGDWGKALDEYMETGYQMAHSLSDIVKKQGVSVKSVLDFGSGYGRVSRFFKVAFPEAKVSVSEVKSQSLIFQRDVFGYTPIEHTEEPSSFRAPQQYDLIFAGSVFTHLPSKRFKEWLEMLIASLTDEGILVFSVHNIQDLAEPSLEPFVFVEHSEDQVMSEIGDRIKDATEYGSAYIHHDTLREWVNEYNGIPREVIRLGFGGTQDLCVVSRR
ncbi:MAG: hypothetical protein SchgKO_01480 [Schleiferiaceae bacterium]